MKFKVALRRLSGSIRYIFNHPLARKNLPHAYWRYISFHLHHLLAPDESIYKLIEPVRFYAKPGMAGIVGNIYTGLDDYEEMFFLLHFLREYDYFVDVGANAGVYSLLAAGVCHAMVTAFEPVPNTFEMLKRNIELNDFEKYIIPIQMGLGCEIKKANFLVFHDSMNRIVSPGEAYDDSSAIQVDVTTLNDFPHPSCPILLKIDAEGYEYPILTGAESILKHPDCKAIIIELNGSGKRYQYEDQDIHQLLTTYGFLPFSYEPQYRKLIKLSTYKKNQFNTLYLRDVGFIQERVQLAQRITILNVSV